MGRLRFQSVGIEDTVPDGTTKQEREHVWLMRGFDINQIIKLSTSNSLQEQWSFMGPNANLRVRAIDNSIFVQTGKTWVEGVDGKQETELVTNVTMFNIFKSLAHSGMIKRRYLIPYKGHILEVDIFYVGHDPSNRPAIWCKVDLEVSDLSLPIPELPFTAEEIIKDSPQHRTGELAVLVPKIYSTHFNITR